MALYRKYRPATFAEVVGQEHVTDPLSTALDTGRISHAYLFSGPRGCGKTSSARILARSLNCVEGPTSRPCGVCPSCVALAPGGPGNLDVIELDAASHGGVDDTRELRDRAFYAPAESRYRVFIVDEAHMVTTAGFNALLKIVEEPPAHLIFIFATTEPDKVLPTIRSRTHHYPFRLLPPATMRGLLGKICEQEQVQVEESVYPLVIRAGGGSPRDSLSVLDQLLAGAGPEGVTYPRALALLGVTDIALIDEAVDALADDDGAALFATVDRVVEAGHDPRRFATDLLERMRDLILLRAVPDAAQRNLVTGPGDVIERMSGQAERIGPATLARYAELLHDGLGEMRGATAPRLLLEVICARMLLPSVSEAESATLQRLERLERRVESGGVPAATSAQVSAAPDSAAPSTPASAAPSAGQPGEPRRRGAEALAALREKKGVAAPHPAQRAQLPNGPQDQRPQGISSAESQPTSGPAAPRPAGTDPGAAADEVDRAPAPDNAASVSDAPDVDAPPADSAGAQSGAAGTVAEPGAAQSATGGTAGPAGADAGESSTGHAPGENERPADQGSAQLRAPAGTPGPRTGAEDQPADRGAATAAPGSGATATAVGDVERPVDSGAPTAAPGPDRADRAGALGEGAAAEASTTPTAVSGERAGGRSASNGPVANVAGASGPAASAPGSDADRREQAAGRAAEFEAAEFQAAEFEAAEGSAAPEADAGLGAAAAAGDETAAESGGTDVLREIEGAWGDIRSKVREFGAAVHALLSGASVARVDGDTIVFAHQHAPLAQRLANPKYVEAVQEAVHAVVGRRYEVRWEVGTGAAGGARSGGAPSTRPANSGAASERPRGGRGAGTGQAQAPRYTRPSQAQSAETDARGQATDSRGSSGHAQRRETHTTEGGHSGGRGEPDDDIPLPEAPDYPDDPGPSDYSSVGYEGVPPALTPEEEQEMLAESARPVPPEQRRDPDEVALELLRTELGATQLGG